ncbi:hypothetical protein [Mesorhizobium loti]|uniref:Uncharacterized protein n=1 Tax=Mesorhizobium loti R88b TaxID=935548 RepID=A0A6M7WLG4_RHILI|nr:hypothetical protein [Mesorhizobium loti]QKD01529.1 hypothetical protein EB235_08370 [Mesorhizobium loti R88b]
MRYELALAILLGMPLPAHAEGTDHCTKSQSPDMPGMAIAMAVSVHVLAERLCNAEHTPLWPWLADVYEKSECLSHAASVEKAKSDEAKVASMGVADAMEGLGLEQAKTHDLEHADTHVKELALSELGGCAGVIGLLKQIDNSDKQ